MDTVLHKRLRQLRARRRQVERRQWELGRLLDPAGRSGNSQVEMHYQLVCSSGKHEPPGTAGGGED